MYELKINGEQFKTYTTLKGVMIAYGKYTTKIDKGLIPITVPEFVPYIEWQKVK